MKKLFSFIVVMTICFITMAQVHLGMTRAEIEKLQNVTLDVTPFDNGENMYSFPANDGAYGYFFGTDKTCTHIIFVPNDIVITNEYIKLYDKHCTKPENGHWRYYSDANYIVDIELIFSEDFYYFLYY